MKNKLVQSVIVIVAATLLFSACGWFGGSKSDNQSKAKDTKAIVQVDKEVAPINNVQIQAPRDCEFELPPVAFAVQSTDESNCTRIVAKAYVNTSAPDTFECDSEGLEFVDISDVIEFSGGEYRKLFCLERG